MGASRRNCVLRFLAVSAVAAFPLSASAAFITFDPDGASLTNSAQTIGGLDWSVGNSLGKGMVAPSVGSTFQLDYQATLAGVINTAGVTVAPTGLNSSFEITGVMSATAIITAITSIGGNTTVHYTLAPVQSANSFFEIWYDNTPDANNLAGTGFNDGARIYLGSPDPSKTTVANYTNGGVTDLFDQFGADDYAGKTSVVGAGALSDQNTVLSRDASFFISPITSMAFNTSKVTPFDQVDPSHLFVGTAGGAAPSVVPNLGAVNGNGTGPNTNDFQFQSDANVSFTVPEPTSVAVMFAGAALATISSRRRRR
jgi:hypothetical protein